MNEQAHAFSPAHGWRHTTQVDSSSLGGTVELGAGTEVGVDGAASQG